MKKSTKFVILCVGVVIGFMIVGSPVYGEESDMPVNGGLGYFATGVGFFLDSGAGSITYSAGGGGLSITDRWIMGGEGHAFSGPDSAGGFGFFDFGYALVASKSLLVYPLLGIGGGTVTREAGSTESRSFLLNPSVGVDYLIQGGLLLGLRSGYTIAVYSDTFNWSMPYIRLLVGGFGFGE